MRIELDGRAIVARRGEPVAVALLCAGQEVLGRSAKYHRARGPQCLSGHCDGCLMRVEGMPSVPTCKLPAREGLRVETQNVWGTAEVDLLALTDQVFPRGLDHHHLMTETKLGNALMQRIARRIAGLGKLPGRDLRPSPRRVCEVDVIVVGEGEAATLAAREARGRGRRVAFVSGGAAPAGVVHRRGEVVAIDRRNPLAPTAPVSAGASRRWKVLVATGARALEGERVELLLAPELVVIPSPRESLPIFPGRDLAGVYSSSALATLEEADVAPSGRLVVVSDPRQRDAGEALAHRLGRRGARGSRGAMPEYVGLGEVAGFEEGLRGRELRLVDGRRLAVDLLVVLGYEARDTSLPGMAGVRLPFDPVAGIFRVDEDSAPPGLRVVAGESPAVMSSGAPHSGDGSGKCVVCRCEDVTRAELAEAYAAGQRDLESLKRFTGFGTGYCQGRDCTAAVARWLVAKGEPAPEKPITPRPPARPVSFAALASLVDES